MAQLSKRLLANLEGHNDPKALKPWTQFLAAGFGGMFSQFVNLSANLHVFDNSPGSLYIRLIR